jgi:hypothetical protein
MSQRIMVQMQWHMGARGREMIRLVLILIHVEVILTLIIIYIYIYIPLRRSGSLKHSLTEAFCKSDAPSSSVSGIRCISCRHSYI